MEVKLEEYVYGGCTVEERQAVREYIIEDFYNAFGIIEMMRNRAHDELAPSCDGVTDSIAICSVMANKNLFNECMFDETPLVMPSLKCFIPVDLEPQQPKSLLAMLNSYLSKD